MKINTRAFTLIELLISIAVLSIIVAVVLPNFSSFRNSQLVLNTSKEVMSSLNRARSLTLASVDSSSYGVHFDVNQIVVFKGVAYSSSDPLNDIIVIVPPAILSNIAFSGGGNDIYFDRLSGAPNKTGTVLISVPSFTKQKTITVSASGAISDN